MVRQQNTMVSCMCCISTCRRASKKRGGGGFGGLCVLSEPLQAFVGEETMIRTQIVKKIWDYIKEKDLQVRGVLNK